MKCFNHTENESAGICRNCSKSICRECVNFQEFPVGIVCSEECRTRIEKLLNNLKFGEKAREQVEEDRFLFLEQRRENAALKQKNTQLYLNLSRQEKHSFILCTVISSALFGYCAAYAKFFDWYFAICLGVILLVSAFNSYNRSAAYQKYALDEG